ncbi:uncharacterized protein BP01DRAFT_358586 [Aspergillus saccharolyticus JOP 1030-1]|uniref:Uncharacterized protein n=1 Tax=Aspergillus saccharolyticus JOP 1030-1 TaxID=1450539 RepID=A0A318Z860_9EURO|nr:hypothetical protein BP01DRAFT_358586 [Aspergillus saccharolyticus JOP 1030-1]PYH43329.1 hypothetical protein BP01DRAFT_358586 [Aspergillus saccharolyticus JOP 1030-1]
MKRCLSSARPLRLRHGFPRIDCSPLIGFPGGNHGYLPYGLRWATFAAVDKRRQKRDGGFSSIKLDISYGFLRFQALRQKQLPRGTDEELKESEFWVSMLEKHLPPRLRRAYNEEENEEQDSWDDTPSLNRITFAAAVDASNTLYRARKHGHLDLLTHLGFRLNNWAAVDFILGRLLDASEVIEEYEKHSRPITGVHWALDPDVTLDELSSRTVNFAPTATPALGPNVSKKSIPISLDQSTSRPLIAQLRGELMAQVWQTLGSLVLEAADAAPNDAKLAMSIVQCTLARLHTSGAISDKVYEFIPPSEFQTTYRPPGMSLLRSAIMEALTDAAWAKYEADMANKAAAAGQESPFISVKPNIRELGPSIWIELILWCCVEHGFIEEGVGLIQRMQAQKAGLPWSVNNWKEEHLLDKPTRKTDIDVDSIWHRPHHTLRDHNDVGKNTFDGLGPRIISEEVAWALLDNLPNPTYTGTGLHGLMPSNLMSCLNTLKFVLRRQSEGPLHLTNSRSNSFLVRLLESGGYNPRLDPRTLADILRTASRLGSLWDLSYTQYLDTERLNQLSQRTFYDQSLAAFGLFEYLIRYFSSLHLSREAWSLYTWLQNFIDTSRRQLMDEFAASPSTASHTPAAESAGDSLQPSLPSLPHLSNLTLTGLLELLTDTQAYKSGALLVSAADIDRPIIPKSLYGDPSIATTILRFAADTKNEALADLVVGSLQHPLSIGTIRALINYRIVLGQWKSVVLMLEYLRDHRLKSWGYSNVTTLVAQIIRIEHEVATLREKQDPHVDDEIARLSDSLKEAISILQRLFTGEFNISERSVASENVFRLGQPEYQARVLYSLHRLVLSLDISPALQTIAKLTEPHLQFKATPRSLIPYIPSTAFQKVLAAVVDTKDSTAGVKLYQKLCLDSVPSNVERMQAGGVPLMYLHSELVYERGDPFSKPASFREKQAKCVVPSLNTIRIILLSAMKEYLAMLGISTNADNDRTGTGVFRPPSYLEKLLIGMQENGTIGHAFDGPVRTTLRRREWNSTPPPQESRSGYTLHPQLPPNIMPRFSCKFAPKDIVLNFCIVRYLRLGGDPDMINHETGGYLQRHWDTIQRDLKALRPPIKLRRVIDQDTQVESLVIDEPRQKLGGLRQRRRS